MAADVDRAYDNAKYRPVSKVQPGWWVRSYGQDDAEVWSEVTVVMAGKNIFSGQRFVRLMCEVDGEPLAVRENPRNHILCCTLAEAKRAGLVGKDGAR